MRYTSLRLDVKLSVWRSKLDAGPILPTKEVEEVAQRFEDSTTQDFVREVLDSARMKARLDNIAIHMQVGNLDRADELMETFNLHVEFVEERIRQQVGFRTVAPLAREVFKTREQKRRAGMAGKRRKWADVLANKLAHSRSADAAWMAIPETGHPLMEAETNERDYAFYRDGAEVIALEVNEQGNTCEIGKLAESTFRRRYLRPAIKDARHQRR